MNVDKIKLFKQPDKCGCVIASIAMIISPDMPKIDYHTLSERYIAHDLNRQGYNTECQNKILNDLGYSTYICKIIPKIPNSALILTVKSLNFDKSWHALVYTIDSKGYHHVFDPNADQEFNGKIHKCYELKDIQNISPNNFHSCTIVTKTKNITNKGINSSKEWEKTVKPFSHEDCKKCTYGPVVNENILKKETPVLIYGGNFDNEYDDSEF